MASSNKNSGKNSSNNSGKNSGNKSADNSSKSNTKSTNNAGTSSTKTAKKKKGFGAKLIICIIVFALLCGGFYVSLPYENKIDEALGLRKVEVYQTGDMVHIGAMNIHFIDVGQGDACLIELPDGKAVLIDAGDRDNSVKQKLSDYMNGVNKSRREQNKDEIAFFDYVIATHSDADHIGSMAYILGEYPAAIFYRPNEQATNKDYADPAGNPSLPQRSRFWGDKHGEKDTVTYKEAIEAGYTQHDKFIEGRVTNPHDDTQNSITPDLPNSSDLYYELNFYGPIKSYYADHNDYSPIIIAEYQGRRVALSGDCEAAGEKDFVAQVQNSEAGSRYAPLKSAGFYADIIKLGHHGSRTSSGEDYLKVMTNSDQIERIYVVISCGYKNSYGHPHDEVMQRIAGLGILDDNICSTVSPVDEFEDYGDDIFFALNLYQGVDTAFVERDRAGDHIVVTYPKEYFGISLRYRNIGIAVLVLFALIIVVANYAALKKYIKKATKAATKKSSRK